MNQSLSTASTLPQSCPDAEPVKHVAKPGSTPAVCASRSRVPSGIVLLS
ncbi:Uncharacterised protein [Mycobacteroides abscessus subsp. abscessus]|nr:Uncharacterised protein [Mycobacteroides abscessus subsp. abscessus]